MRPKVLLLTHRLPFPPNRGDRIRAFHMLRFLSKHADVFLGSVADEPWLEEHAAALREYCREISIHRLPPKGRWVRAAAGLAGRRSATEGAFFSRPLASQVRQWTKDHRLDAAVIYCSSMGQYSKSFSTRPRRVLVDLVDVDSQKWDDYADSTKGLKRMLYRREAHRVRHLERRLSTDADAVSVVSHDEANLFQSCHEGHMAYALSNGVDHSFFAPDALHENLWLPCRLGKPQMVFVGVLDYLPNVQGLQWFCEAVLPLILREYPDAVLQIVGRRPALAVRALGEMPGVQLIGEVEDVRPHVLAADFAIAPLKIARGIQNKVLEALSCGRPVIATSEAATGIDSRGGMFIADTPLAWMETLKKLECEKQHSEAKEMARGGIVEQYSWDAQLSPILEMLELRQGHYLGPQA